MAEACIFPALNDGKSGDYTWKTLAVPIIWSDIAQYCHERKIKFESVITTAWSIVLHRFAEVDNVVFGLRAVPSDTILAACVADKGKMLHVSLNIKNAFLDDLLNRKEWAEADSTIDRSACFNTGIVFVGEGLRDTDEVIGEAIRDAETDCDVTVLVGSCSNSQRCVILYSTSFFSEGQATNVAIIFTQCVASILKSSEMSACNINLFSEQHREKIDGWVQVPLKYPTAIFHEIVYKQSLQRRDIQAVAAWDGTLTYSQLEAVSSQLACHLESLGVRPQTMVPLCFEKSIWAIVAMMAVNKAGAAFVPLDPSNPVSRLENMVEQVSARVVLTSVAHRNLLDGGNNFTTIVCGKEMQYNAKTTERTTYPRQTTDPAYVLFTSGSTGMPKGALHDQTSLSTFAFHAKSLRIEPECRVLQFAPYSFAISFIEIFCTLAAGGTVCIPSDHDRLNRLPEAMNELRVNWALMTPTAVNILQPDTVPQLKTLGVAGEPLRQDQVKTWSERVYLFNAFGMTEWAGICSVSDRIVSVEFHKTVGRPCNCRFWLVDPADHTRLAPIGAKAELLIQGPSLTRRFLNKNEKTSANFLQNLPWMDKFQNTGRDMQCYKTGDIVQYNSDGSINHIGRRDTQFKIRGQRVDVAQVEFELTQCLPGHKATVEAIISADANGCKTLAAFIYSEQYTKPCTDSSNVINTIFHEADQNLRTELSDVSLKLRSRLPTFMIPEIMIPLAHIPLTLTGKMNRRKLREQSSMLRREELQAFTGTREQRLPPSSENEHILHQVVGELLGLDLENIGMNDNFFKLGGDSIVAIRLTSRLREMGLHLTVRSIFMYATLAQMARSASLAKAHQPESSVPFSLVNDVSKEGVLLELERLGVGRVKVMDIYPCTPLQEGFMALGARNPGMSVARVIHRALPGIDAARFKSSWSATVEANPILRTRIIQTEQGLYQAVIREPANIKEEQGAEAGALQDSGKDMQFGSPLVHATLVQVENSDMLFVITIHHAVCDSWSLELIQDQLRSAYSGEQLETRHFRPFINYVCKNHSLEASQEFWKAQFSGLEAEAFPKTLSETHAPTANSYLKCSISLPGVDAKYTISTVVQLAWAIVIAHWTASNDVVFGVTVSGRGSEVEEIGNIVGPTIATIPLRVRIEPNASIQNMLLAVQELTTEMKPFEQAGLQNIQKFSREAEVACKFQSQLVIQPPPNNDQSFFTTVESGSTLTNGFAAYLILLECHLPAQGSRMELNLRFDNQVVQREEAQRMMQHFEHALQYMLKNPADPVDLVPTISEKDLELVYKWNSESPVSRNECVHDIIGRQCSARAHAMAVCSWDGSFTYGELDRLSFHLATHLGHRGVRAEVCVPICFEKSRWTTVAILAVMRAGGAFVLLDPSTPLKRLQDICRDVNCDVVVSSKQTAEKSRQLARTVLIIGDGNLHLLAADRGSFNPTIHPHNSLYLVFTSGTTGRPKGAVIEHRSFCSSAYGIIPSFGLDGRSRFLQYASYTFDASIAETLLTLMAGGCVCVLSEMQRTESFKETVRSLGISHAFLTPSFARSLEEDTFERSATILQGGEAILSQDIARWKDQTCLKIVYGPSECTPFTSVQPAILSKSRASNIGRPVGAVCWVTDPRNHDKLMPIGAIGELVVEGPIVGRGYINDPMKTAEVFIQDPAWLRPLRPHGQTRLYKTGDLVRYELDGTLNYFGRKDSQVKIRGQRVELGEVEVHVLRCFSRATDVVAEVLKPAYLGLVAFVCRSDHPNPEQDTDRPTQGGIFFEPDSSFREASIVAVSRLRDAVPGHMVPKTFIPVRHIPRTTNGKRDRRELREIALKLSRQDVESYWVANKGRREVSTEPEKRLQAVWSRVLDIEPGSISSDDTFFNLGGDSISVLTMVSLAKSHNMDLSVADVYSYPQLCDLASALSASSPAKELFYAPFSLMKIGRCETLFADLSSADPRIEVDNIADVFPASAMQQYFLKRDIAYNFTFSLRGVLDVDRLQKACSEVVKRHDILRTIFVKTQRAILQVVMKRFVMPFVDTTGDVDFTTNDKPSEQRHFRVDTQFTLFSTSPTEHTFKILLSHAQYDGISLQILLNDVAAFYNDATLLPAAQISEYLFHRASQKDDKSIDFWRSYLEGCSLPIDYYLAAGAGCPASKGQLSNNVKYLPLEKLPAGITMAAIFNAAFSYALFRKTARTDICFGQMVHGRISSFAKINEVVGPLCSIKPVRIQIQPSWTIRDFIRHIEGQHRKMMPHEQVDIRNVMAATSWPIGTLLGCIVNHETMSSLRVPLNGIESSLHQETPPFLPRGLGMLVRCVQNVKEVTIHMCVSAETMAAESAATFLEQVSEYLELFLLDLEKPLPI